MSTVKQSYFEPNHLNDIQLNSNVPAGVWDDPDNVYPDINDFEDYQSYQPACECHLNHVANNKYILFIYFFLIK